MVDHRTQALAAEEAEERPKILALVAAGAAAGHPKTLASAAAGGADHPKTLALAAGEAGEDLQILASAAQAEHCLKTLA